jgi:hypothetical protein
VWNLKNLGLVLLALSLVSGLAILYAKTETIDLREPNEIASVLRELKELDARWDVDVLRMSTESEAGVQLPIDRRAQAEKLLGELVAAAERSGSTALNTELDELVQEICNRRWSTCVAMPTISPFRLDSSTSYRRGWNRRSSG